MSASLTDRYRRWHAYERDAHAKTLVSLATIAETHRGSAWQRAVDLFAHIVAARRLWLFRFGVSPEAPEALFPRGVAFDDLRRDLSRMEAMWSSYLAGLHEAELDRVFEYRSLEGERYRNTVEDILTQLFGHSWYHRGQIAQLVRSAGGDPAVTDFVYWTRQPLSRASV